MINVSKEFVDTMAKRTDFKPSAEISFLDGTVEKLGWQDFTLQNNSVTDGAGTSSFPLGVAIEKSIQIELRNDDDRFSEFDFIGARVRIWLSYALSESTEKIAYGTFTIVSPETYGQTVIITAVDDMFILQTARFKNDNFVIRQKPENLTNREFLAMAAQIACGYARMDYAGRLCINSYDFTPFEQNEGLWGGIFDKDTPYSTGDTASGGIFNPWDIGDVCDGGTFLQMDDYHVFYNFKNIRVDTDDVVITGIQTTSDENVYLAGSEGYILSITNQLIAGQEQEVVDLIGKSIIGIRFRPFTADHIAYPLAEFGDLAYIVDRKQNTYQTILTDIDFTFLGYTTLKCAADSPLRNSSRYASSMDLTKAIVAARKETEEQLSDYDKAVKNMTALMANSMGMFETVEEMESGGRITYLHDKPTLSESKIIWKRSELGFMVSQDGGKTWGAGMDASGNAVVNVLSAIGINAEWINAGRLVVKDKNGNITFLADINTGQVIVNAGSVSISGRPAATESYADNAASSAVNAQTQADVFNRLTNNGAAKGMFIRDGQLYFSFSYAEGGTLVLGGANNGNGVCIIRNSSGDEIGRFDKDGVVTNSAKITGGSINITTSSEKTSSIMLNSEHFWSLMSPSDISFHSDYNSVSLSSLGLDLSSGTAEKYVHLSTTLSKIGIAEFNPIRKTVKIGDFEIYENSAYGYTDVDLKIPTITDAVESLRNSIGFSTHNNKASAHMYQLIVYDSFSAVGTKSRIVNTRNYSNRLLYCYETPSPMFGDIGTGITDESGVCYIYFDQIFIETVSTNCTYQVFLQKEGAGDLYVSKKAQEYFIVEGSSNLQFSWEVKAKQRDYEYERMEVFDETHDDPEVSYDTLASAYLGEFEKEIYEYEETY